MHEITEIIHLAAMMPRDKEALENLGFSEIFTLDVYKEDGEVGTFCDIARRLQTRTVEHKGEECVLWWGYSGDCYLAGYHTIEGAGLSVDAVLTSLSFLS